MYRQSMIENLRRRDSLNQAKYLIREFQAKGEKSTVRPKRDIEVTGLDHAIERAVEMTNSAFNGKKMTVLEIKRLRENMRYELPGWRLEIEKI